MDRSMTAGDVTPWRPRAASLPFVIVGSASAVLFYLGLQPDIYYLGLFFVLPCFWIIVLAAFLVRQLVQGANPRAPSERSLVRDKALIVLIALVTTLLMVFEVPLRVGFLTALPGLSKIAGKDLNDVQQFGIYRLTTSPSMTADVGRSVDGGKVYALAGTVESYFVYAPQGLRMLSYNAGAYGHLVGDWYWVEED